MSTTAYAPTAAAGDLSRDARPGLGRLVRVELRKMYDTRAGFWLLLTGVLLAFLAAGLAIFTGERQDQTFDTAMDASSQFMNFLIPIVGILLVTSEWSQRTAQVTFTLVPQRGRVLVAKLGASVALALAAFVVTLIASALFTAIGGDSSSGVEPWSVDGGLLFQIVLFDVISMLMGVALGAAILLSAPAIVSSFVLPLGLALVLHLINGLEKAADWVDPTEALPPMTADPLSGTQWARAGVCAALWIGVPLAVGLYRFLRNEVR